MQKTEWLGYCQSTCDLNAYLQPLAQGKGAALAESDIQGLARHELHGKIAFPPSLSQVEERGDIWMPQSCRRAGGLNKVVPTGRIAKGGGANYLEGDLGAKACI